MTKGGERSWEVQQEVVLFRYPGISLWLLYIKMVMCIYYMIMKRTAPLGLMSSLSSFYILE